MGRDPAVFLRELGIDPANLLDSRARIPFPLLLDAWRRAEAVLDDPSLGLHIIAGTELRPMERLQHESEWVVLQLFVVSATVGEGLQRFARFFPVGFYGSELVLERSEAERALHIRHVVPFGGELPRSFSEFILGLVIRMLQEFPVQPVRARELRLRHAAPPSPPSPTEHERILGTQVTFGAPESSVRIDASELATALRVPNPTLAASLTHIAGEQLASLAPTESLVEKVQALLVAELPAGNPGAERIAEALQLSVRTLARRLAQQGTSHQALLDEVRARLARRYLQEERRPVSEVAELLGFAEPSTFHRAFKRWYGVSPTSFRDKGSSPERR
ncbi:MAG: AraC family transcriptional regulator ligand-binding domain-containing protein [Polyangia bacterium]